MPMPMNRVEPLKGSSQGAGGARLLDEGDVDRLVAQDAEDAEEEEKEEVEGAT